MSNVSALSLSGLLLLVACLPPAKDKSLADLQEDQETYCRELQEQLNSPIQWRLVLDASGSYAGKPGLREVIAKDVEMLLRQLPRREGDSIAIDGFNAKYQSSQNLVNPSACVFDSFPGGYKQPVEQCLSLLLRSTSLSVQQKSTNDHCFSDFEEVVTQISRLGSPASQASERPSAGKRIFYIFLTDGKNEPVSEPGQAGPRPPRCGPYRKHRPLFSQTSPSFLNRLADFQSAVPVNGSRLTLLTRGFIFIVTPWPPSRSRSVVPDDIANDWRMLKEARAEKPLLPQVILHSPGDSYDGLSGLLGSLASRSGQAIPCLNKQERQSLRLSSTEMKDSSQPLALPLLFLSTGHPELGITARTRSYDKSQGITFNTNLPPAEPDGWELRRVDTMLEVDGDRLNGARLPVILTIASKDASGSRHLAQFKVLHPAAYDLLLDFWQERATVPLFLAACFLCLGFWCSYEYFSKMAVSLVRLEPAQSSSSRPVEFSQQTAYGLRYRVSRTREGEIQEVPWLPGIPRAKEGASYYLDLAFLSSLPYFVAWAEQDGYPRLVGGDISYCESRIFSILRPASIWVPSRPAPADKGGRFWNALFTLSWGQEIVVETPQGHMQRFNLTIARSVLSVVWRILADGFLLLGALFTLLGAMALLPEFNLNSKKMILWCPIIFVAVILIALVVRALCLAANDSHLKHRWFRSAIRNLIRIRSVCAYFCVAVFLGSLVAASLGWPLGKALFLAAFFLLALFLLTSYLGMTPRRRIEKQRALREDDFWLDSTLWLWSRVNP